MMNKIEQGILIAVYTGVFGFVVYMSILVHIHVKDVSPEPSLLGFALWISSFTMLVTAGVAYTLSLIHTMERRPPGR